MPVDLTLPYSTLFAFMLVFARVAGAVTFLPIPGIQSGPEAPRIILALAITVGLAPVWPEARIPDGIGTLAVWIAAEAAFGITAGVAVSFLLETLGIAFQLIGLQAGYSYASTIDPINNADSSVLIVMAQLMSGLLFFAFGLDREILRIFAASLSAHPPGTWTAGPEALAVITNIGTGMFATGVRLALPVVVLLLLIDCAIALLGRMHQQLQLITLAFPVKMATSFIMLAAVAAVFAPVWRGAAERTLAALGRIL
ncbi:MAG TPA: flagellar biosynthetic protein FliR [Bryobacteraceae bacterium]|nr:flagellar biosynthetic protein FliR [Bryobacteraceae bacterium]